MATGDDALAAGMDLCDGVAMANTLDTEINLTRDYIAQRTSNVTPVAKGGTGATTAATARTNLGVPSTAGVVVNGNSGTNVLRNTYTGGRIRVRVDSTDVGDVAWIDDVQNVNDALAAALAGKVGKAGDTMTGDLFLPNSTAAVSGYTIAYINSDGRVSRGASSERFKKFISAVDPSTLGNLWPVFSRFQMRSLDGTADGSWRYGYIAERLAEDGDLERFVVYDSEGRPDSIDFIALLMAQAAELNERAVAAEARTAALENTLAEVLTRLAVLEDA